MPAPTAVARGIEVRRKLLDAAVELIPEIGWNAVSTRNLADRAGVAPGLVHYHFRSLQSLLCEAALSTAREILDEARPMFEGTEPTHGIDLMLAQLDVYTGDDPMSLLFTETYLAATRDDELRGELTALLTDFRQSLGRWLEAHGHATPQDTAAVLAAAIDGVLLHRALNPELSAAAVAPVLRRLLTTTDERQER